jgi:hypothetical protein
LNNCRLYDVLLKRMPRIAIFNQVWVPPNF